MTVLFIEFRYGKSDIDGAYNFVVIYIVFDMDNCALSHTLALCLSLAGMINCKIKYKLSLSGYEYLKPSLSALE